MNPGWNRFEKEHLLYIKPDDVWIYAKEYKSGTGYEGGPVNSLVLNLKKSPSKKNTPEWPHRENAVRQFKEDVTPLLKINPKGGVLTAVPSSKTKNHPEYNNRFEDLFREILKSLPPGWLVEWPVEIKKTEKSSHLSRERNPEILKKNYIWKGFKNKEPKILCVFDDVITTGAHLRAMSDFLRENGYKGKIIGICWAKTVWD